MSTTPNQPQNEPELRELLRRLLRGICAVATFFSAMLAAHGLLMTGQFLNDEIPAGKVVSILGNTKTGPRLQLDNGHEAVFPDQVLYEQPDLRP